METTLRRQTSFRLNPELINRLKVEAKKANSSLNNYVESILMEFVYDKPNKQTAEAIEEVMSGKHLSNKPVDMTNVETMVNSILE
jgi:hypothetical protein